MRHLCSLVVVVMLIMASEAHASVDVQFVTGGVPNIVDIQHAGDGSHRLFLVSQSGQVRIYEGTTLLATPFLDLSALVRFSGEQGLLGLAFHPSYSSNGLFYVNYVDSVSGDTVIARYHVSADANVADPNSAAILLTQDQPFSNHKGGQIRFGPDGLLYIALGDGGDGGDPQNHGQRLNTLLGKILRIDVNGAAPYAIPAGNPFVATAGARPEIWSYGWRNPWRFTFDRQSGEMFIADVGQGLWEEIDLEPAAAGGRNYGWRLMEGAHCYPPGSNCNPASLVLPIVEYPHDLGCSVTGGVRSRGPLLSAHNGTYFFGDYCSGRIWGATGSGPSWSAAQLLDTSLLISTFGEDETGNIYVAHRASGQVYRLVSAATPRLRLTVTKNGKGSGVITTSPAALYCAAICHVEAAAGSAFTLTVTASAGSTFVGWSGDADCSDGSVTLSANRQCTAQFSGGFTEDTLVPGATSIRAVHITELRSRIDVQRVRVGLTAFAWTDATLAGGTLVQAVHVLELRTALAAAYMAAGRTAPAYSAPAPAAGGAILAAHVAELRSAVQALE